MPSGSSQDYMQSFRDSTSGYSLFTHRSGILVKAQLWPAVSSESGVIPAKMRGDSRGCVVVPPTLKRGPPIDHFVHQVLGRILFVGESRHLHMQRTPLFSASKVFTHGSGIVLERSGAVSFACQFLWVCWDPRQVRVLMTALLLQCAKNSSWFAETVDAWVSVTLRSGDDADDDEKRKGEVRRWIRKQPRYRSELARIM